MNGKDVVEELAKEFTELTKKMQKVKTRLRLQIIFHRLLTRPKKNIKTQ